MWYNNRNAAIVRLDRLIQKIKVCEDTAADPFVSLIKRLALNEKLEFDMAKLLVTEYKKLKKEAEREV